MPRQGGANFGEALAVLDFNNCLRTAVSGVIGHVAPRLYLADADDGTSDRQPEHNQGAKEHYAAAAPLPSLAPMPPPATAPVRGIAPLRAAPLCGGPSVPEQPEVVGHLPARAVHQR